MYGKIFERVFTGSMFGVGPVVIAVWSYVIAHAKPPGVVELNPRLLAACIGTSSEEVRDALEFLCRPDPESQNPDEEGKRLLHIGGHLYKVVSFEKYRKMQSAEDRREYQREYYQRRKDSTVLNTSQHFQHDSTDSREAEAEAEAKAKKKKHRALTAPSDVSESIWVDFLALRKAKRAAVTPTALDGIRKEADKAGLTLEAALRTCCERGWAGFKADWIPQTPEAVAAAVMRQLEAEGR